MLVQVISWPVVLIVVFRCVARIREFYFESYSARFNISAFIPQ